MKTLLWKPYAALALSSTLACAAPSGVPLAEFGPREAAIGLFFDHQGLTLFEDPASATLNMAGLSLEVAPWRFVQLGIHSGGAEFDVAVPESRQNDVTATAFNGDYNIFAGGTAKLSTPRFWGERFNLAIHGNGTWFQNEDPAGNQKNGFFYQAAGSLQWRITKRVNVVLGGEWTALDGDQENTLGDKGPFGLNQPEPVDVLRGLVGVDVFLPGKNQPFISICFKPTGAIDYDDKLGIRGAALSVSLGMIAPLGKTSLPAQEEAESALDE